MFLTARRTTDLIRLRGAAQKFFESVSTIVARVLEDGHTFRLAHRSKKGTDDNIPDAARITEPGAVRNVQSRSCCYKDVLGPMPNPKVKIFRFCIWVLLMCVAGSITGLLAPHKFLFVPPLFLVLFVPMVLIPTHHKRQGKELDRAVRNESDV